MKSIISNHIDRMEDGNAGNAKAVGGGIYEKKLIMDLDIDCIIARLAKLGFCFSALEINQHSSPILIVPK